MREGVFEGGCLCGAVRYRFCGAPKALSLCHCISCRRAAGAPAVAWTVVHKAHFSFIAGSPCRFRFSPPVERTFCGVCGTQLTYQNEASTETIDITTASLDEPDMFAPTKEIWLEHRIPWMSVNPALGHHAGSSTGAPPIAGIDVGARATHRRSFDTRKKTIRLRACAEAGRCCPSYRTRASGVR